MHGARSRAPERQRSHCAARTRLPLLSFGPNRTHLEQCLVEFVATGFADWKVLEDSRIHICFATGERFLFTDWGVIRLA